MNDRTIAVESHRFNSPDDLTSFMKTLAQGDPWGFRHLARVGILRSRGFVVETTQTPLTTAAKEGGGLIRLASPTEQAAFYVLAIQRQGETLAVTVDNRAAFTAPATASIAKEIAEAILKAFPAAKDKIVFAPGTSNEAYSFMGNGARLEDMNHHGLGQVVAIPEDLGGGFVALSTRDGQRNALWHLTAKKARAGHRNIGSWKAVAQYEVPIVALGVRLYGTHLVLTLENRGLRVVDASRIASQTVREVGQSEVPGTIRALGPIAEADGPLKTGLFTTANRDGKPTTYFVRLDHHGLPADTEQLVAV